jgi:hypothetical protein
MNVDMDFLNHLYGIGRGRAADWLEASFDDVGTRATVDVREAYL